MNSDLAAIERWATVWLVTFNAKKTELITVSRKLDVLAFRSGAVPNPHPPIRFCDKDIKEQSSVKIVGLTISYNLSWAPHLAAVARHARRAIAILRRAKPYLSKPALQTIYKAFVRSRMEYCSPIWMGAPLYALNKLDAIQHYARKIIGKPATTDLQALSHRRAVSALCVLHRILHRTAPAAILDLCPARSPARGGPATRSAAPFFVPRSARINHSNYWARSFIPLTTHIFNSLPPAIQAVRHLQSFKTLVNSSVDLTFF